MPDSPLHIVFAEKFDDSAVERARSIGRVTILETCTESALAEAVSDCDALLVRSNARVTDALLGCAKRLQVIGRGGVGIENIDVQAATERGIQVVYTPAAATDAVADLTVGLLIALLRKIKWADAAVRGGLFHEARGAVRARELRSITLGIIGMGRIGRAVAGRCRMGFGMSIVYNDIVSPGRLDFVAKAMSKSELYRCADVVSLHVPLTEKTRHLVDDESLRLFKAGSLLINTARGSVVDGEALAGALSAGRLGGAALDVFEPEPLPEGHPLLDAPNTLFTPHIAARTHAGLAGMNAVVDDVIRVLEGGTPRYPASS
jgi:D-3-phosphoglycerate dehydrogenase